MTGEDGYRAVLSILEEQPANAAAAYRSVELLSELLSNPDTQCKYYNHLEDAFKRLYLAVRKEPAYAEKARQNPALAELRQYLPYHYALENRPKNYLTIKQMLIDVNWYEQMNPDANHPEEWKKQFEIDFMEPNLFRMKGPGDSKPATGKINFNVSGISLTFDNPKEGFWAQLEGEKLAIRNSKYNLLFHGAPPAVCQE